MIDGETGVLRLELGHAGQANEILAADFGDANEGAPDFEFIGFLHVHSIHHLSLSRFFHKSQRKQDIYELLFMLSASPRWIERVSE